VLPKLKSQVEELLHCKIDRWEISKEHLLGTQLNQYKHLMTRIEKSTTEKIVNDSKEPEPKQPESGAVQFSSDPSGVKSFSDDSGEPLASEPLVETKISIDDFTKVDLRVARIIEASEVEEARKLLRLKLSLGGGEIRNVFAGIKAAYEPEKLVGRLVVCVANLEPRRMKFGTSEAMIVAAGPGGPDIFLIVPDEGAKPGMRLH
jgi:methionyl-tRNA synthetase